MEPTIRSATASDTPAIAELIADRIGDDDAGEAELVLEDGSMRKRWFVAAEEGAVLATAAVFPGRLNVGGVSIGAGAIEFVATHEAAEGRGLVRALMEEIHRTAPSRGEMMQWIVGITYFYRKFGYEYAIPVAATYEFPAGAAPAMPSGWSVHAVEADEVTDLAKAQLAFGARADVSLGAAEAMWDLYRRSPVYDVLVAAGPGDYGYGRVYAYEHDRYLTDIVANSADATAALTNAAGDGGAYDVAVLGRPAAIEHLEAQAEPGASGDAYYLRVGDPVALMEAMRPVLSARLRAWDATARGEALISLYETSIRFNYGQGQVGPIRRGPAEQAPIGHGGSGVAPDRIVALLLGPLGAAELAALNPDVNLGEQAELMEALFPPQTCDVHSWVVP